MPSYVLPQVLVFQEFSTSPVTLTQVQRAAVIGPQYDLHRYGVASEKSGILAGEYNPDAVVDYAWPSRAVGTLVDRSYTRVFVDNALLQYFHDPAGDASTVEAVGQPKNAIRASDVVFATANGFERSASLLRDVQIGDVVKLAASACGSAVSFQSYVSGLVADVVGSAIGSATADISNAANSTAASSSHQSAGAVNKVGVSAIGSGYNGLAAGYLSETYTVEVIGGSADEDATTALLKVTSASGADDVAALVPAAFASPTAIGTRGLTVTFENGDTGSSSSTPAVQPADFLIGQTWVVSVAQAFTKPTLTSGGTYVGASDTTYVVAVSRGGRFADSVKPQISVSTTTGVDISGPTPVTTSGSAVSVGTQGATLAFTGAGLRTGDRYLVPVSAASAGPVKTLYLANNLPDALRGICSGVAGVTPDLDLTLFIKKNIEVAAERYGFAPEMNWLQSDTQISLQDGMMAGDVSWASGGFLVPLPVKGGSLYVQHRDQVLNSADVVGTAEQVSDVAPALGVVDPENPLAFGVYKALVNSNGESVKYLALGASKSTELDNYLDALDVLVGRDDVHSLVPLTQSKDVLDAVEAHCLAESSPENGRWRICWLNMAAQEILPIVVGSADAPVLATITDDPATSGTQYTLVESVGAQFLTNGVRPGDTLRSQYVSDGFGTYTFTSYKIDAVLNEESLRLSTGSSVAVNVPSKIEIHRTLTKNELAANQALKPGLFSNRRATLVWPDKVGNAGVTFPGYFLCAGLAGLRSGVLPHQGLTNVELLGFDDLTRSTQFFSATQLNVLAASGYWIVTQDPNDGTIYTRHQLTTGDQSDVNQKEQSFTTNMDSISYQFLSTLKVYIGRGNVSAAMLNIINGQVLSLIQQLKNTVVVARLGAQLNDAKILVLAQHPTLKDRIVARISVDLPAPFNNLELHLIA